MDYNYKELIDKLEKELEEIQSNWNGDESGLAEDRTMNAKEAQHKLVSLKLDLEYLKLI